jgi:hypothetical protein
MKLTRSPVVVLAVLAFAAVLPACPDDKRADAIDSIGGAPGNQADMARQRLNKAEDKLQGNAAAAAATE